jgi:hypothetical protein
VKTEERAGRDVSQIYEFRWNRPGLPGRKGQRCIVLARGKMNSAMIQFEDGFGAIVSRNALRKSRRERVHEQR